MLSIPEQEELTERADKHLDAALAKGEPFTEGLSNWAINQALSEMTISPKPIDYHYPTL